MALPKRPTKGTTADPKAVADVINKGGAPASQPAPAPEVTTPFRPRVPDNIRDRVHGVCQRGPVAKPMTTYVLEAILEKLDRDQG